MAIKDTFLNGMKSGLYTTWILGKVIFPVTILVIILQFTPAIDWVITLFTPLMKWVGLPGEAAIPLVLGNALNLYAAIGAIITLDLTVKHVFIIAVMLSFSHNLIIESAVAKKIGIKAIIPIGLRIVLAILSAVFIHLFWNGGQEMAKYGMVVSNEQLPDTWLNIGLLALKTASLGVLQIAFIVIPLMLGIQVLKDLDAIQYFAKGFQPLTKVLGLSSGKTSVPLLAGIIFGLAYGAGVIIESAKEENLSKKDMYLLSIFLVSSHAVIEDTLLFIPLGINVLYLLFIRVIVAFIVTVITARVWKRLITHTNITTKGVAK